MRDGQGDYAIKARCKRASVEGMDKASKRTKLGANRQVLRGWTRRVREQSSNGKVLRRWTRKVLRGSTRRVSDKVKCTRASVGHQQEESENKARGKRASVEEIDKASQRTKRGARGQVLRGWTMRLRD